MKLRRAMIEAEPSSFDARDIVAFLQRSGMHGFADFVQHLNRRVTASNVEAQELRDHANSLLERLHKYEPPAPVHEQASCKPPPEASD